MTRWCVTIALALGFVLSAGSANAALTKDQQKCVSELNKGLEKVDKTLNKEISGCVKSFQKEKGVTDINACFAADAKGKIAKTKTKAIEADAKKCDGVDKLGDPKRPSVFATNATTTNMAAMDKASALIEIVFGSDVNNTLIVASADKDAAKCQETMLKDLSKCQATKLKLFSKCKKDAMKDGKDPFPAGAMTPAELETCIFNDVLAKGKIAKTCDDDGLVSGKPDKMPQGPREEVRRQGSRHVRGLPALLPALHRGRRGVHPRLPRGPARV